MVESELKHAELLRDAIDTACAEAINYIESHTDPCAVSVDELLFVLQLPRATLYRAFKSKGGVATFLLSMRLEKAKLLLSTNLSAKEVAAQCGFKSESNFRLRFLTRYGETPGVYRRRYRQTAFDSPDG